VSRQRAIPSSDVIVGGCPDGFWYRPNCDNAARMGLCSLTTIVDNRGDQVEAIRSDSGRSAGTQEGGNSDDS